MAIKLDNIHYDFREIDGYNKPFNFIFSPREPGKTTMAWLKKIYIPWKKNKKPWIYLVRQSVEICDELITSIADTILNKFTDDGVTLEYKTGEFKTGIVDIKIKGEIFVRVVSLNIKMRRIKLAVLKNIGGVLMDEYIIDPKTDEKYIPNEAFKIMEAYTTWRRESEGLLRVYILANPYSLYNPLFVYWNVEVSKLKRGEFYVGNNFVLHWATLNPLLKEKLLKENPLYQFDEDYTQYALEGIAINDRNIRTGERPQNYALRFVFRINNRLLGIYQNNYYEDNEDRYYCEFVSEVSAKRTIYCFDFNELMERSVIVSMDESCRLNKFKIAMRSRKVVFADINCYYMAMEVYENL